MLKKREEARLTSFLLGRKCVFCGSYRLWKTKRGYVKCRKCKRVKGRKMVQRGLNIIVGFHQQVPASRLASDLGVNYRTVERVYRKLREVLYHVCELEGAKLSGEIEIDDAYFGGKRKGNRGRGAAGKSVVLGLLERDGREGNGIPLQSPSREPVKEPYYSLFWLRFYIITKNFILHNVSHFAMFWPVII